MLYYAVRHNPLMSVANASLSGDNLALYLQRKGTREITFVDVPLTGTLGSALWTSFGAKGKYGAAYTADYWMNMVFTPTVNVTSLTDINAQGYNPYNGDTYKLTFRRMATTQGGSQDKRCYVDESIIFSITPSTVSYDPSRTLGSAGASGTFRSGLVLHDMYTRGLANNNPNSGEDWSSFCRLRYDSETSELSIGSDGKKSTGYWVKNIGIAYAGSTHGEFLSSVAFYSNGLVVKGGSTTATEILLTVGKSLLKDNLIGKVISTTVDVVVIALSKIQPETVKEEKPKTISHTYNPDGVPYPDDGTHKVVYSGFIYDGKYLKNNGDEFNATYTFSYWYGTGISDVNFTMYWLIPIVSVESGYVYEYGHTKLLPHKLGR